MKFRAASLKSIKGKIKKDAKVSHRYFLRASNYPALSLTAPQLIVRPMMRQHHFDCQKRVGGKGGEVEAKAKGH